MFILNAFSLNMLVGNADIAVREVSQKVAAILAAAVFSNVLGVEIPCNRATVALKDGDVALVGQYSGPRLPEGATSLPEGAAIKWMVVGVHAPLLVDLNASF